MVIWGKRQIHQMVAAARTLVWHVASPWMIWRPNGGHSHTASSESALGAAFGRYSRAYFQRWLIMGALIGIVAGVGAILFYSAIVLCTHLLLTGIAGFTPPGPAGEGATVLTPISRIWLIPVVTTLGGLLSGFIVYTWAPEAEGHGTDAAIEAFHEKGGRIRSRIPLIKMVASALTIGSGGSAGREGPTAQISAGFGSWLGDLLHLDEHDRRIAMAAGIGSGIGSIFKAPFGGALLSAEVLYKRDFEVEALFPSFVASAVGFTIYGAWSGWTPVFGSGVHYDFTDPASLLGYLILGVSAGGAGLLYPTTLYGLRDLFRRIHVPNQLKPAIGGFLVGIIGLFLPQSLGMGYGYVQFALNSDFLHLAAGLMLLLVFVKILTTSLTIGSGGSGGVFGPGIVIGGFLGAALWAGLHLVAPGLVAGTNAGAFAVVGMSAFFGGIAKAPLAVILMVAEMTGDYALIVPAMLATMVAYIVTGDHSIYESQVPTRLDSPAHKDDYALPLLQSVTVRDAMVEGLGGALATATPETTLAALAPTFTDRRAASVLILEKGRLVGVVTPTDLQRTRNQDFEVVRAGQVMSSQVLRAYPDESLYRAWLRMARAGVRQLPVVSRGEPDVPVGMVTAATIAEVLRLPTVPTNDKASLAPVVAGLADTSSLDQYSQSGPGGDSEKRLSVREGDRPGIIRLGEVMLATPYFVDPSRSSEVLSTFRINHGERGAAHAISSIPVLVPHSIVDPLRSIRVDEAMLSALRLIHDTDPISSACKLLEESGGALLVVDQAGSLVGILTRSDLRILNGSALGRQVAVGEVAVRNLVTARPDEPLSDAVQRMSRQNLRQLPVVSAELPAPPLGLLRRSDVFAAYHLELDGSESKGVQ